MAKPVPWLVPSVWAGGCVPAAAIALRAAQDQLGANPIAESMNRLGLCALVFLVASLACTPVQLVTTWAWPVRIRRALGLLGFGYVTVHFLVYLVLDQQLAVSDVIDDVAKRPFVTVGFLAWCLLIPLALTSTTASIQRLGFAQWKRLHRLAYLCAALGVVHFYWRVKRDHTEPLVYGAVVAVLLLIRRVKRKR